jgi:hypothetical protein
MNIQKIEEAGGHQVESIRTLLLQSFRGTKFITAIILSPIVYIAILKIAGGVDSILMASLFSFQNGFFRLTIFSSSKQKFSGKNR